MTYVYDLIENESNIILHIGSTKRPNVRLKEHIKDKPKSGLTGHGKFYGKDARIEVIRSFEDKKEARKFEFERQKQKGFKTDNDKIREARINSSYIQTFESKVKRSIKMKILHASGKKFNHKS